MAADGKVEIEVILQDGSVAKGVADLTKQFDRLGGAPKKATGGVMDLVKSMGLLKIASSAINVMKDSLDSAIGRFDTMQKFPKVMKSLGFSAEDSEKSITKLGDGIDGLPTKLDDVVASTQQMTAITGDLDRSTDTVLGLNNAFLASGASADDAARGTQQFNQMLSTGTVDLQSWKTLQETMPLALQKTAEAMGYTGKSAQRDLYAALQSGEKTFEEFNDAIIELGTGTGELATLAKENSLGIATSIGNLRNAVSKGVANIITKADELTQKLTGKTIASNIDSLKGIINASFSAIVKSMDLILPAIDAVKKAFSGMGSSGGKAAGDIDWAIMFIKSSFENLITTVKPLLSGLGDAFSNMVGYIIAAIDPIIGGIAKLAMMASIVFTEVIPIAIEVLRGVINGLADAFGPLLVAIGEGFYNAATKVAEVIDTKVYPALKTLMKWVQANQDKIGAFAAAIAGFVTAFMVVKKIITVISTIKTALATVAAVVSVAKTGFAALAAVLSINPFTIIAAAIAGVIALFVWLFNTNETVRDGMIAVWNEITSIVVPIISEVVGFISTIWGGLVSWWQEIQPTFSEAISTVWNAISSVITTVLGFIWPYIVNTWTAIKAATMAIWDGIKGVVEGAIKIVQGIIKVVMAVINGDWSGAWDGMKLILSGAWTAIKSIVSTAIKLVLTIIITTFKNILSTADTIWNAIKSTISKAINGAKDAVSGAIDKIKGFFTSLGDINLFEIGQQVIQGFVNGISNATKWVYDTIMGLVGDVTGWLKKAFKIGSPSRLLRDEIGEWLPPGIAVGVERTADVAIKSVSTLQGDMMSAISPEKIIGKPTAATQAGATTIITNTYNTGNDKPSDEMGSATFEIPVSVEIDAATIVKKTFRLTWAEIKKLDKRDNRYKGVLPS